jgi:hypothetical protein
LQFSSAYIYVNEAKNCIVVFFSDDFKADVKKNMKKSARKREGEAAESLCSYTQ